MGKNAVMALAYGLAVVVSLACLTVAFLAAKSHRTAGPTLIERVTTNHSNITPKS